MTRHGLTSEEGPRRSRIGVARRRQLVAWVQDVAFRLGGGLLTFSDSEYARRTTGVNLVRAVLRCLEMPNVKAYVVARET